MFLWWKDKVIENDNIISEKIIETKNQNTQKEIAGTAEDVNTLPDIYFPVGVLVMPGKLKMYDPLILKCYTSPDAYVAINNLHFRLSHYIHHAFAFRFIPTTNMGGHESVQLESVEFPGLFIAIDNNNYITVTSNLSEIANFQVVNGLSNFWHISLKHINSNKYLRHCGGLLRIDDCVGAQFLLDATFLPIVPFPKSKLNIILRGHIRNSFLSEDLKNLMNDIASQFDISIFVHSWNVVQNNLSYRHMSNNDSIVNEDTIKDYFGEYLSSKIKYIMIEDDKNIELLGSLDGFVGGTRCPVKGYKNMLYGKAKIANYVYNNVDHDEKVVQFRFDIMSNPFPLKHYQIIDFLNKNVFWTTGDENEKMKFISDRPIMGIDNIFISSVSYMFKFLHGFYSHFDEINNKYRNVGNQEYMCFYERNNF